MSSRSLKISFVVILSSLVGCGASATPTPEGTTPSSARASAVLDGTSYEVTLAFPGEAPLKDTLDFEGGRFPEVDRVPVDIGRESDCLRGRDAPPRGLDHAVGRNDRLRRRRRYSEANHARDGRNRNVPGLRAYDGPRLSNRRSVSSSSKLER